MVSVGQLVEVHGAGVPFMAQVREAAGDVVNVLACGTGERFNGLRPVPGRHQPRYWAEPEPAGEEAPEQPEPTPPSAPTERLGLFASTEDDIEGT